MKWKLEKKESKAVVSPSKKALYGRMTRWMTQISELTLKWFAPVLWEFIIEVSWRYLVHALMRPWVSAHHRRSQHEKWKKRDVCLECRSWTRTEGCGSLIGWNRASCHRNIVHFMHSDFSFVHRSWAVLKAASALGFLFVSSSCCTSFRVALT